MATAPDYCPYEFINPEDDSQIIGFDIDLAEQMAEQMGHTLNIISLDFRELLLTLISGQADFVMAAMTPTEERRQDVDFSITYFEEISSLLSPRSAPLTRLQQIFNKQIGVRAGTIYQEIADEKGAEVILFEQSHKIPLAIRTGQLDAALLDQLVAQRYAKRDPTLEIVTFANEQPAGSAIAVPRRSPLLRDFNRMLRDLKSRGEIDRLAWKWFDHYTCPGA
jgi:ABC-type amino acid transport substrate-binding protein